MRYVGAFQTVDRAFLERCLFFVEKIREIIKTRLEYLLIENRKSFFVLNI